VWGIHTKEILIKKNDLFLRGMTRICVNCKSAIDDKYVSEENIEFWICPNCKKKSYKYETTGWVGVGKSIKRSLIRKESRDLR
jgi:ribosomal protein L37AE/L43A